MALQIELFVLTLKAIDFSFGFAKCIVHELSDVNSVGLLELTVGRLYRSVYKAREAEPRCKSICATARTYTTCACVTAVAHALQRILLREIHCDMIYLNLAMLTLKCKV